MPRGSIPHDVPAIFGSTASSAALISSSFCWSYVTSSAWPPAARTATAALVPVTAMVRSRRIR
nr:hypothetical protein [Actinoplanes aksuensis]